MKKKLRKYIILPLLAVLWLCGCGKKEETDKAETVPDTAAETESQTEETEEKEQKRTQYPVSEADTETIYADREKNQTEMDRLTNYRRHLQNKIRRASPAEKETLREEKNGVTERITELRKRLKYADGIEKRSAHIDDCLNQIHDTVENQRSNQNGRTDRKREDALR